MSKYRMSQTVTPWLHTKGIGGDMKQPQAHTQHNINVETVNEWKYIDPKRCNVPLSDPIQVMWEVVYSNYRHTSPFYNNMERRAERKRIHTKYSNELLSGHIQAIHKVIRSTHKPTESWNEWTVTVNERLKYVDIVTQLAAASSILARMSVQNTHIHTHTDAAMRDVCIR